MWRVACRSEIQTNTVHCIVAYNVYCTGVDFSSIECRSKSILVGGRQMVGKITPRCRLHSPLNGNTGDRICSEKIVLNGKTNSDYKTHYKYISAGKQSSNFRCTAAVDFLRWIILRDHKTYISRQMQSTAKARNCFSDEETLFHLGGQFHVYMPSGKVRVQQTEEKKKLNSQHAELVVWCLTNCGKNCASLQATMRHILHQTWKSVKTSTSTFFALHQQNSVIEPSMYWFKIMFVGSLPKNVFISIFGWCFL